jgi:hemolysin activation/secretion protein
MPRRSELGFLPFALRSLPALVILLCAAVQAEPPAASADAAAAKDENYFDIHEFRVLGNSVLPSVDVERAVYPFLGDHKKLSDVEAARAALESVYHEHGYATVFVDIPEQEITESIVRLRATEGRIHETRISGARYFSEGRILAALPAAAPGGVPQLKDLQRQLAAVNAESADQSVVPVLKAGPVPGTVDIALKVDDHLPLHGSVEINNQNSLNTESLRALYALSYANLFSDLDNVALHYQNTPQEPGQVGVIAANYTTRPFDSGVRYAFSFIDSTSNVLAVSTLGVLGKGQIYGARILLPPIDGAPGTQQFTLGADYKHFEQSIALPATATEATTMDSTPISYMNLSIAYAGYWHTDQQQLSINTSANFGPRGWVNDATSFADKRYQGRPNYFYVREDGTFTAHPWAGWVLTVRVAGQYAIEPLINNEQYSITGVNAVRGYLEAESLSDAGINGTLQLASPVARRHETALVDGFVFFDAGLAHFIDPLADQLSRQTLRSFGSGLDLFPGRSITGSLTWAYPLDDAAHTRSGDPRLLFFVRGSF